MLEDNVMTEWLARTDLREMWGDAGVYAVRTGLEALGIGLRAIERAVST